MLLLMMGELALQGLLKDGTNLTQEYAPKFLSHHSWTNDMESFFYHGPLWIHYYTS